jgi:predicted nucleotidyltransferase
MSSPASLLEVVRRAALDLAAVGARSALVGGLAVGVHALERATRDADFAVAAENDATAERITADLVARGYTLALALEQTDTGRLATVRLRSPIDGYTSVDVLFASSGIEAEIVRDAIAMDIGGGVTVPVARRGDLIALKLLARNERRPQDDQDLGALLHELADAELQVVRARIDTIVQRGFARGKDLASELASQLERWR